MRRTAPGAFLLVTTMLLGCATPASSTVLRRPTAAPPRDSLDQHFEAIAVGLESEGLRRGPLRERGFLPPSGRAAYPVRIEKNECAVFVSLATPSMADLDAALYTPEGAALIEDDSTSSRPTLTFCAPVTAPIEAYLALHAYQGAGSFVAAQLTRARRADDDLRTATTAGDGASALGQLAQTLRERGFEDAAPRVSLPLAGGPVRLAVHVTGGECYTLAAEGDANLGEVGLRLVDAQGGELAHGVGEAPASTLAALQYCADDSAELSLEVVARRGQGVAQVARFRVQQAVLGGARALWLGEPSPSPAAWSGAKSSTGAGSVFFSQSVSLRQGEVTELVPRGKRAACSLWQAALEPGLSRVTLRLESERGELLGEVESEHMAACLVVCAPDTSPRVSLLGRAGFGAVLLTGQALSTELAARVSGDAGLVFGARSCHGSSAPVASPPQVEALPRVREQKKAR